MISRSLYFFDKLIRDLSAKTKREVTKFRRRSGAMVVGEASAMPMAAVVSANDLFRRRDETWLLCFLKGEMMNREEGKRNEKTLTLFFFTFFYLI